MTVKRVRLPIVLTVALAPLLILLFCTYHQGWQFTPLVHISLDAACLLCALSAIGLHFYFARLFRQHVSLSQELSEKDHYERELTHYSEMLKEANNEMDAILRMAVGVFTTDSETIEAERQRLRTVIDLLPVGIFITHSSSGTGSLINRKGIALLGDAVVHETGALGYSSTYNLCRPDGQPYPLEELPLHRTLSTGEPTEAHDAVLYHPDGREILLWIQAAPIKDKAGRVTGAISVYHDVTEQERYKRYLKHYAEMLEEANHEMDAILQSMAAGVLTVDAQGYVTTFNSAAEEILGIPRQEAIGRHCADVLGPDCGWGGVCHYNSGEQTAPTSDHPPCLPCVAGHVVMMSEPYDNREQTIRRLDGRPVILNVRTAPLRRQDQVIGAVKIFYDVTLLKEAQKAQAAMRAQNQFLSTMSHELRTPLNSILALSQLLLEQSANGGARKKTARLDSNQRECLEVIHRNGQHLLRLINDLMDLTKIEAGKVEVQTSEFSFRDVLEWVLASVTPLAQKKGLIIQCALPSDLPQLYTDEKKVNQVLFNLLSNAIKFTDAGGRVTVSAEVVDGETTGQLTTGPLTRGQLVSGQVVYLRVAVADTGIGIPAHQIPLVFERFRQLDEGMARKYDGAGLGLTISKSLVELLGGRIKCDSVLGSGSIFTFEIPIRYPHATVRPTDEAKSDSITALTESSHPQKKILIVEDDPDQVFVLQHVLETMPWSVVVAEDGEKALLAAERERPDLILMDIHLPHMSGYEATMRLKESPALQNTPIIALTAAAMSGMRERMLAAGCDDYMSKPYKPNELIGMVQKYLSLS